MPQQETIVMQVGGSLIVPDAIDTTFIQNLKALIEKEIHIDSHSPEVEIQSSKRFIIIAGGGRTARRYQEAAGEISALERDDIDWLGIHATHLNGHLLRTIFRDMAYPVMIKNPDDILDVPKSEKLIIAGGYRPGCSTDLRAIQIAERVGAKKVITFQTLITSTLLTLGLTLTP